MSQEQLLKQNDMTNSEIFKAAHKLAKTLVGNYAAKLSMALKSVYASLKEIVEDVIEEIVIVCDGSGGVTRKQLSYLMSFDNFSLRGFRSTTQIMKNVDRYDASRAIGLLKEGETVVIAY